MRRKRSLPPKHFDTTSRRAAKQVIIGVIGVLVVAAVSFTLRYRSGLLPWQRTPPYYASAESARPFPATLPPSLFTDPVIERGYEIASRIPEVLVQQPSYCNLGRNRHRSLLDCFMSNDAAQCKVCLQEAVLADNMTGTGKSAVAIRTLLAAGGWKTVVLE